MNAIQNRVFQLRKELSAGLGEPGGGPRAKQVLTTTPTGYLLTVPNAEFDLQRYRAAVADASATASSGDLHRAADLLHSALGMWQGSPLVDVAAGPVLLGETSRLHEENTSDRIHWIVLSLRLQRYVSVIGELRALTEMDEYDESLNAYLMYALHMTGRRNAALVVYHDLRQRLTEHLGLEPSNVVQRLQRKIMLDSQRDPVRLHDVPWHSSELAAVGVS